MVFIVSLEDGCLIFGTSADTVVYTHDFTELIKGLEDVDADASVEPSWLEQPQILLVMTTLTHPIWRLY